MNCLISFLTICILTIAQLHAALWHETVEIERLTSSCFRSVARPFLEGNRVQNIRVKSFELADPAEVSQFLKLLKLSCRSRKPHLRRVDIRVSGSTEDPAPWVEFMGDFVHLHQLKLSFDHISVPAATSLYHQGDALKNVPFVKLDFTTEGGWPRHIVYNQERFEE